jgi:hypothetical protein
VLFGRLNNLGILNCRFGRKATCSQFFGRHGSCSTFNSSHLFDSNISKKAFVSKVQKTKNRNIMKSKNINSVTKKSIL